MSDDAGTAEDAFFDPTFRGWETRTVSMRFRYPTDDERASHVHQLDEPETEEEALLTGSMPPPKTS
jgi:hypothetical protein